jgi:hypothetical protein
MDYKEKTILGRTGLMVGRLGISSSYGASAEKPLRISPPKGKGMSW